MAAGIRYHLDVVAHPGEHRVPLGGLREYPDVVCGDRGHGGPPLSDHQFPPRGVAKRTTPAGRVIAAQVGNEFASERDAGALPPESTPSVSVSMEYCRDVELRAIGASNFR